MEPAPGLGNSREWWERGRRVIPLGTQTLSKSPTQWLQGVAPIYLQRGQGAHVWDVDSREFIDYPMALGPVLLGYRDPAVDDAIRRQLNEGITFTLMHPLEVEVAERIVSMCPGVEAVRFGKTGSDAMSGAVRAARALTGRDHVLVAGYHGWHDWYIGTTTRRAGVPLAVQALTSIFDFDDLVDLERALCEHDGQVAAVVLEPSGATVPSPGYLEGVIKLCSRYGAVSIFDEIITGFRLAPGGARERYGVQPDLSCYGKALGNGMPISAVAGSWDVMRTFEEIFVSGTHGGECLSLAAARAVLDCIATGEVLPTIHATGVQLLEGISDLIRSHGIDNLVAVGGEPERAVVGFPADDDLVVKTWIQQCLLEAGILFNGSMFICARHDDEDLERTLAAFDRAFAGLEEQGDLRHRLRGEPLQAVFRKP